MYTKYRILLTLTITPILLGFLSCTVTNPPTLPPNSTTPYSNTNITPPPPISYQTIQQTNVNILFAIYMGADNDLMIPALSDIYEIERAITEFRQYSNDAIIAFYNEDNQGYYIYPTYAPAQYYPPVNVQSGKLNTFDVYNNYDYPHKPFSPIITNFPNGIQNPNKFESYDPMAIENFLKFINSIYNYNMLFLVFWSHGNSYFPISEDDRTNSVRFTNIFIKNRPSFNLIYDQSQRKSLSVPALRQVLSRNFTTKKPTILAIDACLMGTLDVVYELRNNAQYILAARHFVQDGGLPYEHFLQFTKTNKTTQELANTTVNAALDYINAVFSPAQAIFASYFTNTSRGGYSLASDRWIFYNTSYIKEIADNYYNLYIQPYTANIATNFVNKIFQAYIKIYSTYTLYRDLCNDPDPRQSYYFHTSEEQYHEYIRNAIQQNKIRIFSSQEFMDMAMTNNEFLAYYLPSVALPSLRETANRFKDVYNKQTCQLLNDYPLIYDLWYTHTIDFLEHYAEITNLAQYKHWTDIENKRTAGISLEDGTLRNGAQMFSNTPVIVPYITNNSPEHAFPISISKNRTEKIYAFPYPSPFTIYLKITNTTPTYATFQIEFCHPFEEYLIEFQTNNVTFYSQYLESAIYSPVATNSQPSFATNIMFPPNTIIKVHSYDNYLSHFTGFSRHIILNFYQ